MSGVALLLAIGGRAPGNLQSLAGGSAAGSGQWQLNNDGTTSISGGSTPNWVLPANATIAAFYEVKVDVTSGSFTIGTTGSYLSLGTTRAWGKTVPGSVDFNVTIREIATGIIRLSQTGLNFTVS